MRLLDTTPSPSGIPRMQDFIGAHIPPYAILSHTWDQDEVTLQHLTTADPQATTALRSKAGFLKVQKTCAVALARDGLAYAWVDTCCIDKTSSAELAEAINSMYAWYRDAAVCYVYLADLEPGGVEDLQRDLPRCRWWTRGWTLQELIAPREAVFFDRWWNCRGSKSELAGLISAITGIPEALLRGEAQLSDFAVARRMSWAARRETTRVEDMAYCLLGIFDVNMSLIYGEGRKAFRRLQTTIIQNTADLSVFVWTDESAPRPGFAGVLAESPRQFANCTDVELIPGDSAYLSFTLTARGIQTDASLPLIRNKDGKSITPVLDTYCHVDHYFVGVCLRKIGGGLYARYLPDTCVKLQPLDGPRTYSRTLVETVTLVTQLRERYPFHPGPDPVLGNRCSALRVDWGPIHIVSCHRMPRSHWDPSQRVFFSCNPRSRGWCAFFVQGKMGPTETTSVNIFLACFDWNKGPLTMVMASLDDADPATTMLLERQLDRIAFESSLQPQWLVKGVFGDTIEEEFVDTPMGIVTYYRNSRQPDQPEPELTLTVRKEEQPDVCVNPVTVLQVAASTSEQDNAGGHQAPRTPPRELFDGFPNTDQGRSLTEKNRALVSYLSMLQSSRVR
jgi:hypothetical protein